jgi:subtilase family serine protease
MRQQNLKNWALVLGGLLALAVAACSGGGGSHGVMPGNAGGSNNSTYTGPQTLANFEWGKALLAGAQYVGPVTGNPGMVMHVMPQLQNAQGLVTLAQEVNNPSSAMFRHFITPQEIGASYGASDKNLKTLIAYLGQNGLRVSYWPQKLMLNVQGQMSAFSQAFGTTFGVYQTANGQQFIAPSGAPHTSIAMPISAVVGMVQLPLQHSEIVTGAPEAQGFGYSPQQVQHAFHFTDAYNQGYNGSGVTAGIIGTGPIALGSNGDFANFQRYTNTAPAMASEQIMPVTAQSPSAQNDNTGTAPYDPLGGANLSAPPPYTNSCNQPAGTIQNFQVCNPEDVEAQLDTEQVASLAPGLASVDFYLAYERSCYNGSFTTPNPEPTGACPAGYEIYDLEGIDLTDDEIQQAIADNVVDTVSMSFGEGENAACYGGYFGPATGSGNSWSCPDASTGLGPLEIAALSAEGIAVFISSGDQANDECQNVTTGAFIAGYCVSYPGSDPNAVSAGGINVGIDNSGNITDQITDWGWETYHGACSRGTCSGSGGGFSQYFTVPSFQSGVGTTIPYATTASTTSATNPAWGTYRGVPDVELIADPTTGVLVVYDTTGFVGGAVGGTSVSAPELNGQWAVVLSACKATAACDRASGPHAWRLGNPNGYYYRMAANSANYGTNCTNGTSANCAIEDVLYGNNVTAQGATLQSSCCYAGTGWDPATGLGVPFTGNLVKQVLAIAAPT